MPEEDPDLVLVQALQSGEDTALNELMGRHQQKIFHFIIRHVSNEADAVELAQETFVRAYFNINRFKPSARFSTWLHQIALNLCRDHVRSKQWRNRQQTDSLTVSNEDLRQDGLEKELKDNASTPEQSLLLGEQLRELQRELDRLPIELKGPLLLTAVDGFSHQEAARKLGLSPKAVEVKIYRARKILGELLSRRG